MSINSRLRSPFASPPARKLEEKPAPSVEKSDLAEAESARAKAESDLAKAESDLADSERQRAELQRRLRELEKASGGEAST